MSETVFILAGSNMGDREKNLADALAKLEFIEGLEIVATSAIYLSEADGMDSAAPSFMNQAVMADYRFTAGELLNALELIEKKLGRTGKGQQLPRTIDLDILLFGQQVIESERLSIPHRELLNRPFAMAPILQIDPKVTHPVTKRPVSDFLSDEDRNKVMLYKDHVARQP
ncbi:MAG: 2-amino-4-hydroxy-6-hydroxymethyldihydropteridine diphosphokinase [candidate division Zixibacteria bacterium]|nr:2-amino-4-hydroxy-6-hydroxymethyldihydropteridine diphosphokinase [candidate division Zixibacteria bacterium]MDH3936890.1 2-amino-4-hydroxy-6-hydroxymethyldihydropteridine diphosphokinase [candidate division Zixibacteria bacterium]MDH4034737.1 2-amino-4-hydroxy-6-hydroxymethyldihydropteridine diphosphokinase [candidate division Zixibacteria bacterium]